MRRLMVPLDGSAFAESSLPYVVTLAQAPSPCAIDLVGVDVPPSPSAAGLTRGVVDVLREQDAHEATRQLELDHYLREMAARLRTALPDVEVRTVIRHGNAVTELAAHAADSDVAATVLTTHGRGGWDRVWFGSVTSELMRRLDKPVLAVRPAPVPRDYLPLAGAPLNTALVAVDESLRPTECLVALDTLLGHALDAITLVHVALTPPRALGRVLESESRDAIALRSAREASRLLSLVTSSHDGSRHRLSAIVREGADPADSVLEYIDTHGAHLLTLATSSHTLVERLLFGSVADRLLQRATVPVLFVHRSTS
ncbi:MAG: universal stress protein [Gemmatimonadaceae bacterium]|nr:universal stress protein [Gemmatimonadaceae bacterium]